MVAFDIEAETAIVKAVLAHPAGYNIDWGALHSGGPFCTEETFDVEWELSLDGKTSTMEVKSFPADTLDEAAAFYVRKRHELEWGLDFEQNAWGNSKENQ